MSFKGQYNWISSFRQGGRKAISFTLTCTNMFQSETFDAVIIDGNSQKEPMFFRGVSLKAKKSLRFDYDTVGWDWQQGDYFAILDKHNNISKSWPIDLKIPAPGECQDCHGTHRCRFCNGTGMIRNKNTHDISSCENCKGTGVCQSCFFPSSSSRSVGVGGGYVVTPAELAKNRKIESLRMRISELQSKLDEAEWDRRMMQLRGSDVHSHTVYSSQLNLKYQYQKQIHDLQFELQQLESM